MTRRPMRVGRHEAKSLGAHGGAAWQRAIRRPSDYGRIVAADVNDMYFSPAPAVLEVISRWLPRINYSPDTESERLRTAIAEHHDVSKHTIVVGNGSSELLHELVSCFAARSKKAMILDPTYIEYARVAQAAGASITRVRLSKEDGFVASAEMLSRSATRDTGLVVLCNPNNPTGRVMVRDEVRSVLGSLPQNCTVLVDETYIEFTPAESVCADVARWPNLIVVRTFSKAFGLAGLRVAYAVVGRKAAVAFRQAIRRPWIVGSLAQRAAEAALKNVAYVERMVAGTLALKVPLTSALSQLGGISVIPSDTHFFLVDVSRTGTRSQELQRVLANSNVFVRECSGFGRSLGGSFVRVTTQDARRNQQIIAAFTRAVTGCVGRSRSGPGS